MTMFMSVEEEPHPFDISDVSEEAPRSECTGLLCKSCRAASRDPAGFGTM